MDVCICGECKGRAIKRTGSELLYLLYFTLMFGAKAAGLDEGNMIYRIVFVGTMLLFAMKILITEHSIFEYIWMILLLILASIIYRNTGEKGFLLCITMMIGMKGVNVRRLFRIEAIVLSFFLSLNVFLSVFGFRKEWFYFQDRGGMVGDFRHALGYPHPNSLQLNCFILVMLIMFIVGRQSRLKVAIISLIMLGMSLYIFIYSGSRTGIMVTILYLIVNYYFIFQTRFSKLERILIQMVYPLAAGISVFIPLAGSAELIQWVSEHMDTIGSRVRTARYYYGQIPLTLFGSRIEITKDYAYGVDIAYAYLLLVLGIVAFVIISLFYIGFIHNCVRYNCRSELAITLCIVLMGILEPFLFNLSFKNISLLFIGQYLFYTSRKYEDKIALNLPVIHKTYSIKLLKISKRREDRGFEKEISYYRMLRNKCKNKVQDRRYLRKNLIILIVTVMAVSLIYLISVKKPVAVYTNSDWSERTELGLTPIYISSDQAEYLRMGGNILINYQGDSTPMYKYVGIAAENEYFRRLISMALWCGIGSMFLYDLIDGIIKR